MTAAIITLVALLAAASSGLLVRAGAARARRRAAGFPDASAILVKHPAVTTILKEGEMVLSLPKQAEGLALNAVAARCWELIDGSRTMAEIGRRVAADYGVSRHEGLREARTFARRLKQELLALEAGEQALVHVHVHDVFFGETGGEIFEVRLSENLVVHAASCLRAADGTIQPWRGTALARRRGLRAMKAHRSRETTLENAVREFESGWEDCGAGRLLEAEAAFRRCTEAAPSWANAHYQLGYVCLRLRRNDEAIRCFETTEAISPGYYMVREYLDQARRLAAGALSHEAFVLFDRASAAGFRDPDATIRLARKAIEITPRYPSAHLILARAYEKKERLDLALAELSRTLEMGPDEATLCHALLSRGSIFMAMGRHDQAMRELSKVIEINGSTTATRTALATLAQTAPAH